MKTELCAVLCSSTLFASIVAYEVARPGQPYHFPDDHFNHPRYQTEWWYYTGNLEDAEEHRYGFELTFFRQANAIPDGEIETMAPVWRPDHVYLAHLAFTDAAGKRFYHTERLNRQGPGLAGAQTGNIWNGNWRAVWKPPFDGAQTLQGVTDQLGFQLNLVPEKPSVSNGKNGVSQKGPQPGEASHYISFTRLDVTGNVQWDGRKFDVKGLAWMDHEYFTEPKEQDLAGWDWFAIQLSNHQELMLYQLRSKSGGVTQFSSGTYIDAAGKAHFLAASEFQLVPRKSWHSTQSNASYPVAWAIMVPGVGLELTETPVLENQELVTKAAGAGTYWEGTVNYSGKMQEQNVTGRGYLELTGYAGAVSLNKR